MTKVNSSGSLPTSYSNAARLPPNQHPLANAARNRTASSRSRPSVCATEGATNVGDGGVGECSLLSRVAVEAGQGGQPPGSGSRVGRRGRRRAYGRRNRGGTHLRSTTVGLG